MKSIQTVEILSDYWLKLLFTNGEVRYFDCKSLRPFPEGSELNIFNGDMFNTVHLERGALEWDNGYDICPDFTYMASSIELPCITENDND